MSSTGSVIRSPASDPFVVALAARVTALDAAAAIAAPSTTIDFTITNGVSAITTGIAGDREVRVGGFITAVRLFADVVGSIVIDIWKDTYANFPPVVGDSIVAAAKPTLASAQKYEDTDLTGWLTAVTVGDVLRFNVDSVATVKKVTVSLTISPEPLTPGGGTGGGGSGGGTFTSYQAAILAEAGLVAMWPLGEAAGTLARNAKGVAAQDGTYDLSPTLGVPGPFNDGNTAVTLNGTNQGVTIPHTAALNLGDVWTIEAWIQRGATGTGRVVLGKGTGAYEMRIDTNGALALNKANTGIIVETSADIGTGWHHVVATKNGAANHVYVDGAEPAHSVVANQTTVDNGTVLQIGENWDGGGKFNGTIADVALYSVALTPQQVAAHYAAGVGAGGAPVPGALPSTIPASVDKTGATNCHDALEAYLNSCPPGTKVAFDPAGIYRVDTALKIQGRVNLDLNGQGCTVKANGTGFNENYSLFYFVTYGGGNSGIKIHDFVLQGSDPTPGTFTSGQEGQHGVLFDGTNGFEAYGITGSAFFGDMFEVNSGASNGRIHNNVCTNTGRNCVSIIWGNHVEIDHNSFTSAGYMPFDVEPNFASQPSSFINFHDNVTGSWTNAWFALDGSHTGAAISDIQIVNNRSVGKSLLSIINNGSGGSIRNPRITFSGNTSDTSAAGPVLRFNNVDQLVVQHNVQPLSSGSLVSVTSCPGAVITPNP